MVWWHVFYCLWYGEEQVRVWNNKSAKQNKDKNEWKEVSDWNIGEQCIQQEQELNQIIVQENKGHRN